MKQSRKATIYLRSRQGNLPTFYLPNLLEIYLPFFLEWRDNIIPLGSKNSS
jgi:hypothetical protein